ncbi:hypothetical protein D0Z08_19830 [Nocardioides immobilis]|uniref:ABM domain-containing protein n=1 Tax=Nocardioides immobilis TaxID=2049295 RepID=A0A417XYN6_9ACTN|nr:hypothetical protein [Nocardioides immobilis]RHW25473.1 hypothetical protein D0Z08_19830 [Nocardioides immobilis]
MFARSSTFSGDPAGIDDGVAFVRDEVMPMLGEIAGCVGLSMMVDRETGECIVTTSWESADAMRASSDRLTAVRGRLGGMLQAPASVQEWEIMAMHRTHKTEEGAGCRVTWFRTDHADVDQGIDIYRTALLPRIEMLPGFCSASLMVDRSRSRACSTASFNTFEALDASREEAWAIRDAGVREAGVDVIDASEFELVIANLRVPELV